MLRKNQNLRQRYLIPGCLLCLLLCHFPARAQIVDMEVERFHRDSTVWSGSLTGNISLSNYGTEVFYINAGAHVQYQNTKDLYLLLGNYGFLKGNGQSFIDNGFLHFRYNHKLGKVVRWEAFSQLQQNTIINIQSRFLLGTGPRFKILGKKNWRLYAAALLMYERDKETNNPHVLNEFRNSSYVSFTFIPAEKTEITSTTYYQPLLNNFRDYHLYNVLNVNIATGKKLSVNIKWTYQYDAVPAGNAPKYNYDFSTGLELKL